MGYFRRLGPRAPGDPFYLKPSFVVYCLEATDIAPQSSKWGRKRLINVNWCKGELKLNFHPCHAGWPDRGPLHGRWYGGKTAPIQICASELYAPHFCASELYAPHILRHLSPSCTLNIPFLLSVVLPDASFNLDLSVSQYSSSNTCYNYSPYICLGASSTRIRQLPDEY